MLKKIAIGLMVVAALTIWGMAAHISTLKAENRRYKENQSTLLKQVETYKTESGKNAASVQRLQLTYDELAENYADVVSVADELRIKLKRMQSVSTAQTVTAVEVHTEIRDSIVYRDNQLDSLLVFGWSDPWVNVEGVIEDKQVDVKVESADTLIQIVHRIPHKFWFIKWGTKAIRQEIVSTNPHTKIVYSQFLEITK